MKRHLLLFTILITFLLAGVVYPQTTPATEAPTIPISKEKEIQQDIQAVPCENLERLEGVRKLFISKGAKEGDIKIEDFGHVENLVIEKKGKIDEIVIIGAHYDELGGGCGVIDNWTGIVIIANLYKTIRALDTIKTYKFVAFGKEEHGRIGSKAMAGAIPKKEREKYCAMVNLDSFGFTYPQVIRNITDKRLLDLALETAKALKMPTAKPAIRGASSDSASFLEKNIPAISIHGLPNNWQSYLHSSRDKIENVNYASVYFGYRFTLRFVAAIEARPCSAFRESKKEGKSAR